MSGVKLTGGVHRMSVRVSTSISNVLGSMGKKSWEVCPQNRSPETRIDGRGSTSAADYARSPLRHPMSRERFTRDSCPFHAEHGQFDRLPRRPDGPTHI